MNDLFIRIVRIVLHISSIRIICYTVFFGYDPSEHGCPRYRVFVPFDRQSTIVTHSRPRIFTIFQHLSDGTVGRKGVLHHFTNRTIYIYPQYFTMDFGRYAGIYSSIVCYFSRCIVFRASVVKCQDTNNKQAVCENM